MTIKAVLLSPRALLAAALLGVSLAAFAADGPPPLPPSEPSAIRRALPAAAQQPGSPTLVWDAQKKAFVAASPGSAAPLPAQAGVLQPIPAPFQQPGQQPIRPGNPTEPNALVFDALQKEYKGKPGDTNAPFVFNLTNVSSTEVTIYAVRTSCGCTVAKVPPMPWKLAPGTNGVIEAVLDLRGKRGILNKTVTVDSSSGLKLLTVSATIADEPAVAGAMGDRSKNQMTALADRQAVFKGECASCHVTPTVGKMGQPLFAAACGICHEAEHRASMVTDLNALKTAASREYWHAWVSHGKPGTLMPGFAQAQGGPLSDAQITSLVDYLSERYATRMAAGAPSANPVR